MKNVKSLATVLSCMLLVTASFAQSSKKEAPAVKGKPVPAVIIVLPGDPNGGADQGLTSGLESYIGAPLSVTTVSRDEALKDPKYKGLNLDFMPLYLIKKTPETTKKFEDAVKNGYLKTNEEYVIFEHQTRNGVYVNRTKIPNQLDVFVMAQCPYGVMAENRIIDAKKLGKIPANVNVNIRYIVGPGSNGEQFSSLHGTAEWEEDVRQLIIKEKFPAKFWKYLEIRDKDVHSSRWDKAAEDAGLNPQIFRKYWDFGVEQLKKEISYSNQYNVSASPTFIWEGRVITDFNGMGQIKALEGLAQTNFGAQGGQGGQQAPSGQC